MVVDPKELSEQELEELSRQYVKHLYKYIGPDKDVPAPDVNTNAKIIFPGKAVPSRFGPPWAGRGYELALPARTGTAAMQDGYDVIKHIADLPSTQEFLSVKLCRLFVHENFFHGVYDYTDPNLTPEGRLIIGGICIR